MKTCPHCKEENMYADEPGAVDGPREYHAECWEIVDNAIDDALEKLNNYDPKAPGNVCIWQDVIYDLEGVDQEAIERLDKPASGTRVVIYGYVIDKNMGNAMGDDWGLEGPVSDWD